MHRRLVVITMRQNTIFQNLKRHIFYMHHKVSSKSNRVFHKIVMGYKIQLLSNLSLLSPIVGWLALLNFFVSRNL